VDLARGLPTRSPRPRRAPLPHPERGGSDLPEPDARCGHRRGAPHCRAARGQRRRRRYHAAGRRGRGPAARLPARQLAPGPGARRRRHRRSRRARIDTDRIILAPPRGHTDSGPSPFSIHHVRQAAKADDDRATVDHRPEHRELRAPKNSGAFNFPADRSSQLSLAINAFDHSSSSAGFGDRS